ncbi:2651_t:CDS:2 [Dentiscutata heterogama]|uniref:2651_t:CDS:1 n=1 Tax=Dentiscutata heterogama TaxID=1316150 RepID=A0ACA9KWG6_9GLOM|nr:2651_t:CDS:2 [Dentiscutata heterogama]
MGNIKSKKHNDGAFSRSLDENEVDSYQIIHNVFRSIWNGNYMSPITPILKSGDAKVLDIGCGPGTWACDMSSDFRNSTFIGVETLPMFPIQKPSNVEFKLHKDFTSRFPFEDNSFDFIHLRFCWFYFTFDQWRTTAIKELVRLLKPGGWLEFIEISLDGENLGPVTLDFITDPRAQDKNLDPMLSYHLSTILSSVPNLSSEVYHEMRKIPCGSWGGNLGVHHEQAVKGLILKSIEHLPHKTSQKMIEQILYEFKDRRTFSYCHRIYVQKLEL